MTYVLKEICKVKYLFKNISLILRNHKPGNASYPQMTMPGSELLKSLSGKL